LTHRGTLDKSSNDDAVTALYIMQHVKALSTALGLLEFFTPNRDEWGVTELAAKVGLHKSQVSRILRTFEVHGFIQRHNVHYQLGQAFKAYASRLRNEPSLSTLARPIMEKLSKQTQGTVLLKVREGRETITIERVESEHFLRLSYPLGLRLPLNVSSSGKVLLAYMPKDAREQFYRGKYFQRFTVKTKTKAADLEKDIALVRRRGYAVSDEEHLLGARGVAAPIFGRNGDVEATLGLGLPTVLLPTKEIDDMGSTVQRAAMEISSLLGYQPSSDNDKRNNNPRSSKKGEKNGQHQRS
jgi:IclR family KDG regulon transcriptional repressor